MLFYPGFCLFLSNKHQDVGSLPFMIQSKVWSFRFKWFSLKNLIFSWKTFLKKICCPQDMIGNFSIAKVWCCLGLYWSTRGCNLAAHSSNQRYYKIIDCCKNLVWIIILKIWRYGEIRVKCVAELTEEPIKVKTLYFKFLKIYF